MRNRISKTFYEVSYYSNNGNLIIKHFETFNNAKKHANHLHSLDVSDELTIIRTWCYRPHKPRHKTWFVSTKPNEFIKVEHY
jgi:hypothetical protein